MAYQSSVAAVRKITDCGIYGLPSTGSAISQAGALWVYQSTHASTAATVTGFFAGCGRQPSSAISAPVLARSPNNVGMAVGDIVICVESTGGATPGRVTVHSVLGSSFNQASTSGSSSYVATAGFDVSISST